MNIFKQNSKVNSDIPAETLIESPPPVDAVIHITIADKDLEACINIEPPQNGGAPPNFDMMQAALSSYNISYNVDIEKLKEIEASPVYSRNILIACGIAPIDGIDGTISFQIKTEKSSPKPKNNEDGSVDYYDLDIVENVIQGQVLCVITPPTEGTPGISVKGKEIQQKKGQPAPSYLGNNTELNEDGTAVLSKIDGQVMFTGNKINVDETFYVKGDIDISTGNIKVVGNLVVLGMVLPGFTIEADGNIDVKGIVEASTIKAGGNIKLQSGIVSSSLNCDGNLNCRFIENCNVYVKGDIKAEYIINSAVTCGKNVQVNGLRARIIGGNCVAGKNIEAHTIGSPAGTHTRLELGTDPTVMQRQQELLAQIAALEKSIKSLDPLITMLHQLEDINQLSPEKRQTFDNVGYNYDTNTRLLQEDKRELEEIAQSIKAKGFNRILCTDTIHPGTTVVIGNTKLSIKEDLSNASLYYNEGSICIGSARE